MRLKDAITNEEALDLAAELIGNEDVLGQPPWSLRELKKCRVGLLKQGHEHESITLVLDRMREAMTSNEAYRQNPVFQALRANFMDFDAIVAEQQLFELLAHFETDARLPYQELSSWRHEYVQLRQALSVLKLPPTELSFLARRALSRVGDKTELEDVREAVRFVEKAVERLEKAQDSVSGFWMVTQHGKGRPPDPKGVAVFQLDELGLSLSSIADVILHSSAAWETGPCPKFVAQLKRSNALVKRTLSDSLRKALKSTRDRYEEIGFMALLGTRPSLYSKGNK